MNNQKQHNQFAYQRNAFVCNKLGWTLYDSRGNTIKSFGKIDAYVLLNVLVVKQDGLYGLVDLSGECVRPCCYINVSQPFHPAFHDEERHEVLLLEDESHLLWLTDKNGKIVTSRGHTRIGCAGGKAEIGSHDSWDGVINTFYEYYNPMDLRHKIECCGLFDIINLREIIPAVYSPGAPFCSDTSGIYSDAIAIYDELTGSKRCKLIDINGKDVIPFEEGYVEIEDPDDENLRYHIEYLFYAKKDGKYGYVNIEGVVKIPFQYDIAYEFYAGYAIVGYGDNHQMYGLRGMAYGVIDHHNRAVIPFRYDYINAVYVVDGHVLVDAELQGNDSEIYDEYNNICEREENVSLSKGYNDGLIYSNGIIKKKR